MSIIDIFANMAIGSQQMAEPTVLKLDSETISTNLNSYLQGIIQKHLSSAPRAKPADSSLVNLEHLHQRVRLCNEDGVEFLEPIMPANEEMLYRQNILGHYLNRLETISEEELHLPELRDELVAWVVCLHAKSKFKPETLYLAVRTIDRFLARRNLPVEQYNTLGATALWIAAKFEECYFGNKLQSWLTLADSIPVEDVEHMEEEILTCFDFQIAVPNAHSFFEVAATYLPMRRRTVSLCRYLMDLSLLDCKYLRHGCNLQAAAVMYLAVQIMDPYNWNEVKYRSFRQFFQRSALNSQKSRAAPRSSWSRCSAISSASKASPGRNTPRANTTGSPKLNSD